MHQSLDAMPSVAPPCSNCKLFVVRLLQFVRCVVSVCVTCNEGFGHGICSSCAPSCWVETVVGLMLSLRFDLIVGQVQRCTWKPNQSKVLQNTNNHITSSAFGNDKSVRIRLNMQNMLNIYKQPQNDCLRNTDCFMICRIVLYFMHILVPYTEPYIDKYRR